MSVPGLLLGSSDKICISAQAYDQSPLSAQAESSTVPRINSVSLNLHNGTVTLLTLIIALGRGIDNRESTTGSSSEHCQQIYGMFHTSMQGILEILTLAWI